MAQAPRKAPAEKRHGYRYTQQPPRTERFWMVWKNGGPKPRKKHHTLASASGEAVRLSLLFRGTKFHVLEAIGYVYAVEGDHPPAFVHHGEAPNGPR